MASLRDTITSERYIFHWNLVSIMTCLFLAGFSSLAWMRADLQTNMKITIELLCCVVLMIDLYFHKPKIQTILKRSDKIVQSRMKAS